MFLRSLPLVFFLFFLFGCSTARVPSDRIVTRPLSQKEATRIGERIWINECGGKVENLVFWKEGEDWPSVGIGHFIWPPKNYTGPFKDGHFHEVLDMFTAHGVTVPYWAGRYAPWPNRSAFLKDKKRRKELERLLLSTFSLQAEFIIRKFYQTLPSLIAHVPPEERPRFTSNVNTLLKSTNGTFALIDYLHFKGAGIKQHKDYQGYRWGLIQVVLGMDGRKRPIDQFIASAKATLYGRVIRAKNQSREEQWLAGWYARLDRYRF